MRQSRPNLGRTLAATLGDHALLQGLLLGHRRARACLEAALPVLPPALRQQVRAGPIEPPAWTLFVSHNAAAAKLRQCLPNIVEAVRAVEPQIGEIRVKVSPPADHSPR